MSQLIINESSPELATNDEAYAAASPTEEYGKVSEKAFNEVVRKLVRSRDRLDKRFVHLYQVIQAQ